MPGETHRRADQSACDQDDRGQKGQTEAGAAFCGILDIAGGVQFAAYQIDDAKGGTPEGVEIMAEQIQSGNKSNQLLQSILLNAKMPLENLIAGGGGGLDPVLSPSPADLEAENNELKKCERSHDIDISHGCSSHLVGF